VRTYAPQQCARGAHPGDRRLGLWQHALHDNGDAFGIWMLAIELNKLGIAATPSGMNG